MSRPLVSPVWEYGSIVEAQWPVKASQAEILDLGLLRRLSRSERPKLLYDGRHPPGSGDQWPAVAQGLVGREELAGGK